MANLKTIYLGQQSKVKCTCGKFPKVGDRFWYTSKYDGKEVEGIVQKVYPSKIESTKGVSYPNNEISLTSLQMIREEKLNDLGI